MLCPIEQTSYAIQPLLECRTYLNEAVKRKQCARSAEKKNHFFPKSFREGIYAVEKDR